MATQTTATKRPLLGGNLLDRPAEEARQQAARADDDLLDKAILATTKRFSGLAKRYEVAIEEAEDPITRFALEAEGMKRLRALITDDMLKMVRELEGTQLGFGADRPYEGRDGKKIPRYDDKTVRDCLIIATLKGFRWTGNEWMILHGAFFGKIDGWKRKLKEVSGVTDLRCSPGVPYFGDKQLKVRVGISWKQHGIPNQLLDGKGEPGLTFVVDGGSADLQVGKAKARAYRAAYELATGSEHTVSSEVDDPEEAVATEADAVAAKLAVLTGKEPSNGSSKIGLADVNRLSDLCRSAGIKESEFLAMLPGGKKTAAELTPAEAAALADRLSIEAQDRQGGEG